MPTEPDNSSCSAMQSAGLTTDPATAEQYLRSRAATSKPVGTQAGQVVQVTIPPSIAGDPCSGYRVRAITAIQSIDQAYAGWLACRKQIV